MANETVAKFVRWALGTEQRARRLLRRTLTVIRVGTPLAKQGNRQGGMDGVSGAGVCWPVDPSNHDGASFLASDVFYAFYDAARSRVHMLDGLQSKDRHRGAFPLKVGANVFPLFAGSGGVGIVIRTAKFGTDGIAQNIFIGQQGLTLIAHHLPPNAPANSTKVFDPNGAGRSAGLHGLMRVIAWLDPLCGGVSGVIAKDLFQLALNGSKSNGDQTGWLACYFAMTEAVLSAEQGGPLWHSGPGDSLLQGGLTADGRDIRQGATNIGPFGLFTVDTTDPNTGPLDWEPEEDPDCADVGIWARVHFRADRDKKRTNFCGEKRLVVHRWSVRFPLVVEPDCRKTQGDPVQYITDPDIYMAEPNVQVAPSVATPFKLDAIQYAGRATPNLLVKGRV